MTLALVAALGAALCYGVASVLEGIGARREATTEGVDPRLLVRLLSQGPFIAGLGLDLIGFILSLAALRTLPLFVVQAIVAGNLAVTAVLAARIMREPLSSIEWAAVGGVCVGLALLGLSSGAEVSVGHRGVIDVALLAGLGVAGALGIGCGRLTGRAGAMALGGVAGLGFAATAIAARVIHTFNVADLIVDPAAWALAVSAVGSFVFFATALQRGAVTIATSATVVVETLVPAAVGVFVFGDTTRSGWAPVGALGFLLAVVGALALSRFGEVEARNQANGAEGRVGAEGSDAVERRHAVGRTDARGDAIRSAGRARDRSSG